MWWLSYNCQLVLRRGEPGRKRALRDYVWCQSAMQFLPMHILLYVQELVRVQNNVAKVSQCGLLR